ncbi:MAG TPA: DUF2141 domain-containing protein [Candidatus Kapabacteria bacterium]|nr:DUF2141 domain-containing protein [Candidatus Kapabacteria bacterium]
MKLLIVLIFVLSMFSFNSFSQDAKCNLKIEIFGFSNNKGKARISVFSKENKKAFPDKYNKASYKFIVPIKDKKVTQFIENIPYGEYAVIVHHDENDDDELNTNWLGMPKESFGASNDAKGSFGPPDFEDAKFLINKSQLLIKINMNK